MRKNISVSLGLMNHNYVLQSKNTQLKNALILNSFSLSSYPDSVLNDDATFFYQNNIAYFPLELGYIVKLMKSTYGKLRLGLYSRVGLGPLISMNQFFILENNKKQSLYLVWECLLDLGYGLISITNSLFILL